MSGVYSLSTTADITFILPKLDLKKPTKKQLNFSNSIFCSVWKTEKLFIIIFFSLIIPQSTLQKCSIIYYYLPPLIIDLSYPKVLYQSVLLASKNVAFPNLTSLPKHHSQKRILSVFYYVEFPLSMWVNKRIKSTQKQKAFCKTCCKLTKHSVYIKLGLTLQSSTSLKIGELLLTANSPNLSDLKIWTVTVNG